LTARRCLAHIPASARPPFMMLRLNKLRGIQGMSKTTVLTAVVVATVGVGVVALLQSRNAVAAIQPDTPPVAVVAAEPAAAPKPVSRRARMARVVAEQAAITAEASARRALARIAEERYTAMR